MPGPPPKPAGTRARRNPAIAMTPLASSGRTGPVPAWPLLDDVVLMARRGVAEERIERLQEQARHAEDGRTARGLERQVDTAMELIAVLSAQIDQSRAAEQVLWAQLWRTPQAEIWEKLAWDREVAQYVRWKVRGEMGDLDAAKEARAWSDRLGLNPLAMLRLRWEIERTEDAEDRGRARRAPAKPRAATGANDARSALKAV